MKIVVDADACPVKDLIISIGRARKIPVELVASFSHQMDGGPGVRVITVEPGPDAVDLIIANRVSVDDIVVTQDYGLAALVLGKKGKALTPRGLIFTDKNIDGLLMQRHLSSKVRRSGGKTKGPPPLSNEDRDQFKKSLLKLLE